jgi:hypothetical protein
MTLVVLVSIALLSIGCSLVTADASLRIHHRNSAEHALGVQVDSGPTGGGWTRLGDGHWVCSAVRVPWTVTVGGADRDGAVGDYAGLLSSAEVADPTDAEIWIDVARDGGVTWGEGRPAWATEDAPKCGAVGS